MIKNIIIEGVFICLFFGLTVNGFAGPPQEAPSMTASVTVNPVFNISLTSDPTIDFGYADPGTSTDAQIVTLTCETNDGKHWVVSIHAPGPLVHSTVADAEPIPNSNFNWNASSSNGIGQVTPSSTMSDNTADGIFYEADSTEHVTDFPIELTLSLSLVIPSNAVAGYYSAPVYITMYET